MTFRLGRFCVKTTHKGIPMERIGIKVTKEQKAWLDEQSEKMGESVATLVRLLINQKIKGK